MKEDNSSPTDKPNAEGVVRDPLASESWQSDIERAHEEFAEFLEEPVTYRDLEEAVKREISEISLYALCSASQLSERVLKFLQRKLLKGYFRPSLRILNEHLSTESYLQSHAIELIKSLHDALYYSLAVKKQTRKQRDDRIKPLQKSVERILKEARYSLDTERLLASKPRSTFPDQSAIYQMTKNSGCDCAEADEFRSHDAIVLEHKLYKCWPTYREVLEELEQKLDQLRNSGNVFARSKGKLLSEEIFSKRFDEALSSYALTLTERRSIISDLVSILFGGSDERKDWVVDVSPWVQ